MKQKMTNARRNKIIDKINNNTIKDIISLAINMKAKIIEYEVIKDVFQLPLHFHNNSIVVFKVVVKWYPNVSKEHDMFAFYISIDTNYDIYFYNVFDDGYLRNFSRNQLKLAKYIINLFNLKI